jgi:hypothetical protein
VTVPLSLLKSEIISFTPPLPTKKTDAIKRLGAGLIEKVRMDHLHYRLNLDINKSRNLVLETKINELSAILD